MRIRNTKKRMGHFWTYYLLPIVFGSFLISWGLYVAVEAKDEYKGFEKIDFFGEAYSFLDDSLKKEILEINKDKVFQVNTHVYSPRMNEIAKMYTAYGVYSDILLLREQDLRDMDKAIQTSFLPMNDAFISYCPIPNALSTYDYQGTPYAIKVYDVKDASYNAHYDLGKWLKYDETLDSLYLLVNLNSENVATLNNVSKNDAALTSLRHMLEKYSQ